MCEYYIELASNWQRLSDKVGAENTREFLRKHRQECGATETQIEEAEKKALGQEYSNYRQFMGA